VDDVDDVEPARPSTAGGWQWQRRRQQRLEAAVAIDTFPGCTALGIWHGN
jgi:hypothetical protein